MVTGNDKLTCAEAIQRLDDYIDRELSEEEMEAVRVHLEFCAHCADQFQFEETVLEEIRRKFQQIPLPENLSQRTTQVLLVPEE